MPKLFALHLKMSVSGKCERIASSSTEK